MKFVMNGGQIEEMQVNAWSGEHKLLWGIKVLVFDMDQTLYGGEEAARYLGHGFHVEIELLAEKLGVSYEEADQRFNQTFARLSAERGEKTTRSDTIVRGLGLQQSEWNRLRAERYKPEGVIKPNRALRDAISRHANSRKFVVATNSPNPLGERVLRAIGIRDLFNAIYAPTDSISKPNTGFYARIVADLMQKDGDLSPNRFLSIGDRVEADATPAIAAGMNGAVIISGPEELIEFLNAWR